MSPYAQLRPFEHPVTDETCLLFKQSTADILFHNGIAVAAFEYHPAVLSLNTISASECASTCCVTTFAILHITPILLRNLSCIIGWPSHSLKYVPRIFSPPESILGVLVTIQILHRKQLACVESQVIRNILVPQDYKHHMQSIRLLFRAVVAWCA
jgi:hypothetical protein